MDLAGFGFDLAFDLDLIWIWLDLIWIWFDFGLDLVGFGLLWLGFWSIIAFIALVALLGGPRRLQVRFVEAP